MKKIKRIICFCLSFCLLASLFSGCGGVRIKREKGYNCITIKPSDIDYDLQTTDKTMQILKKRLDDAQINAAITRKDGDILFVEVFEQVSDKNLQILCSTGRLSFKDSAGLEYFNSDHITSAHVEERYDGKGYSVIVKLTKAGVDLLTMATRKIKDMEDNTLYIWLGNLQISAPTVQEQIVTEDVIITNCESYEDALTLAVVIDGKNLPVEYTVIETA